MTPVAPVLVRVAFQLAMGLPALAPGVIDGRIVSAVDGAPIPAAVVTLDSLALRSVTDTGGRYRLEGVPGGRWTVAVAAEGYVDRRIVVRVPADGTVSVDLELARVPRDERTGTILGTVREQGRLEPIRFATVRIGGLPLRAVSDENGLFSLTGVPVGLQILRAEAPGYRDARVRVTVGPGRAERVSVHLERDPVVLPEVLVPGTRAAGAPDIEAPGAVVLDSAFLDLVPTIVERDVLRAVQALPSVTPSSDYSAAPFVRGGTPDQTAIYLDGAPIYNPFHIAGFASAFAPTAVAATVLRAGGLPASAPSSLSGILEVQARDGGRDSVRVAGSLGLLSTHTTVDGPLRGGRAAFLVAARRTYVDVATGAASVLGLMDEGIPYGFSDLHGKLTHDLGGTGSVSLTGYVNRESFDTDQDGAAGWGNDLVSARFTGFVTGGLLADLGAGTSAFSGSWARPAAADQFANRQGASRLSAAFRTWFLDGRLMRTAGRHTLWVGARWERTGYEHLFEPDQGERDLIPPLDAEGWYGPLALYARDLWRVAGPFTLDWGVRLERPRKRAWYALPRGRFAVRAGSGSVALAAGRYVRDRWSLRHEESVSASVVGYDLPVATTPGQPAQKGWDVVLETRWNAARWRFRADLYVKRLEGLPTSPPLPEPLDGPLIVHPDSISVGRLDVEGVEVSAAGRLGGTSISLAYRWQRETRTLGDLRFTPRTNRPHRMVALASRRFGEREAAISITWMSGLRFTPPLTSLTTLGGTDPSGRPLPTTGFRQAAVVLAEPNSGSLPSYLRIDLDLRGAWDWTLFGRRGVLEPYVSVLNLLDNRNVLFSEEDIAPEGLQRSFGPQLPVLPTIGLRWRF